MHIHLFKVGSLSVYLILICFLILQHVKVILHRCYSVEVKKGEMIATLLFSLSGKLMCEMFGVFSLTQ